MGHRELGQGEPGWGKLGRGEPGWGEPRTCCKAQGSPSCSIKPRKNFPALTSSKPLGKKRLVLPAAYEHLAKGYEGALNTSCAFLGVSHPPSPSTRMKAAGGRAVEAVGAGRQLASTPAPLLSAPLSSYSGHWEHGGCFPAAWKGQAAPATPAR